MNSLQRFKEILLGLLLIFYALVIMYDRDYPQLLIVSTICLYLIFDGIRKMVYYVKMARHMVGGKSFLYQGIIVLDIALFTIGLIQMSKFLIMIYLMGVYAFSGAIDILRALEAKKNGSPSWNMKLISGCIRVAATIALFIIGIFFRESSVLIYGYCINLGYAAVMRFINAFRRTAIVYIQ